MVNKEKNNTIEFFDEEYLIYLNRMDILNKNEHKKYLESKSWKEIMDSKNPKFITEKEKKVYRQGIIQKAYKEMIKNKNEYGDTTFEEMLLEEIKDKTKEIYELKKEIIDIYWSYPEVYREYRKSLSKEDRELSRFGFDKVEFSIFTLDDEEFEKTVLKCQDKIDMLNKENSYI